MNDYYPNAGQISRRTRTVMLRFTELEFEKVMAARTPEVEVAVFLRNLTLTRLEDREGPRVHEVLASLVSTYAADVRFEDALDAVKVFVIKRDTESNEGCLDEGAAQLRVRNVMLRFTDEEFEKVLAAREPNSGTAVFLRTFILDSLANDQIPTLRESVAFVISSLLPEISFEEVLEKFDRVAKPRSVTHEVHQESERSVFLVRPPGLPGNI